MHQTLPITEAPTLSHTCFVSAECRPFLSDSICFAPNSVKSTGQNPQAAGVPQQQLNNGTTMVYFGGNAQPSSAAAAAAKLLVAVAAVAVSSLVL